MEKVLLFSLQSDHIKVTIEAFFEDNGNLVIEGYDIGKPVEEYWGDSDYEYSTNVPPDEVDKLYRLFDLPVGSKQLLLDALRSRYHGDKCYSEIRDFLTEHQ